MITKDEVEKLAKEWRFIDEHTENGWREYEHYQFDPVELVSFAKACYQRGIEDAAKVCDDTANEAIDTYGSAYLVGAAEDIRKLGETK